MKPEFILILIGVGAAVLLFLLLPQMTAPAQEIRVSLLEWAIEPQTITASAGKIKFVVTNEGKVPHAFEIEGEIRGREFEAEIEEIKPGETKSLVVTLPAGDYEVYYPIPGHRERGMEAILVVKGKAELEG